MFKKLISGLLCGVMLLSLTAEYFSIDIHAAAKPVFEYDYNALYELHPTYVHNMEVIRSNRQKYTQFKVTSPGSDPYAVFATVPKVSKDDKYIAVKYRTSAPFTTGSFYFAGDEPPAHFTYKNNGQWNTMIVDASTAEPTWSSMVHLRFDIFNTTSDTTGYYVDLQYIAFFYSKAMAHSYNGTVCKEGDLTVEYDETAHALTVTGYSGAGGDVKIESEYDTLKVTAIGDKVFSNIPADTTVTIPSTVTSISETAFEGAKDNVTLSVTYGSYAHTYAIQNGFNFRTDSESSDFTVEFSANSATVTGYIGSDSEISVPSDFAGIPTTSIASNAFEGNTTISSLTIPDSVVSVGSEAFADCSALQTVNLGSGLQILGKSSFKRCNLLTSVSIPATLKEIPDFAFLGCSSLENITLPEGIERIGMRAFDGCILKNIDLPSSVTSLGKYAFINCKSLSAITVSPESTTYSSDNGALISVPSSKLIYVPEGNSTYTVSSSVTSIERAAYYNTSISEISIPENVKMIGDKAFASSSITKITVPRSVEYLGYGAFDSTDITVYCYRKSAAHIYANDNVIPYIIIADDVALCDINGDGIINNKDIIELKLYLNDNTHIIFVSSADIDKNGTIDSADISALAAKIAYSTSE